MYQVSDTMFGYGHNALGGYIYQLGLLIVRKTFKGRLKSIHRLTDTLWLPIFITRESIIFALMFVIK